MSPSATSQDDVTVFFGHRDLQGFVNLLAVCVQYFCHLSCRHGLSCLAHYDGYLGFVGLERFSPPEYEAKRYNKLKDTERTIFRGIVQNLIIDYWKYNRQIPDGGEVNQIMTTAIKRFEEELSFTVKNDKDLRRIVQSMVVPTINKQLRRENKKKEEG